MTTVEPQKIQMIKDMRAATGLGLGEAKAVVDYLYRHNGPVQALVSHVRNNPDEAYTWRTVADPDLDVYGAGVKRLTPTEGGSSLEERVSKIERFIQNMYTEESGS